MSKLIRFLMPIVIAVVLGPLIAGIAVTVLALVVNLIDGTASIGGMLTLAVFYISFAYIAGAVIALLAGLLISIWMVSRPPSLLVAVGAAVLATLVYMGIGATGVLGPVELTNARSNFLFTLAFAVIAAAACWLLTRRYVRPA